MSRARQILEIVATDNTFELLRIHGSRVWVGRCIHCRTRLVVPMNGEAAGDVTIEHIVPRHHGGTDDVSNLALACSRCNGEKGIRHDHQHRNDPRRLELEAHLIARRKERWRTLEEGERLKDELKRLRPQER